MSLRRLSILIALASAVLFSLLHLIPVFALGDYRVYDLFLRLSPRRRHIDNVVFVNADDTAIATIGVFPWPRSVIANGLLKLKEHGAQLAIFDIEYIDNSPTRVDELYLRDGLSRDYNRHFSEISSNVAQLLNAIASGNIPAERAAAYIDDMAELVADERDALLALTRQLASDDDLLLAQAAALFGRTWGTLNIQAEPLLEEQGARRPIAEERFAYSITNLGGMSEGVHADLLLPILRFAQAVKGAGFTNVYPDADGVRRRVFLTQEVHGNWYLQLAFAPLMDSRGSPDITVHRRRMVIGEEADQIIIPLDSNGAMLLDWPREDYFGSYDHLSFSHFNRLDTFLANIEEYLKFLEFANNSMFPVITRNAAVLQEYFTLQRQARSRALEEASDEAFFEFIALRDEGLDAIREFVDVLTAQDYIGIQLDRFMSALAYDDPDLADELREEADYCRTFLEYIDIELTAFVDLNERVGRQLAGKMCIIGRTDTGTTDIGVNPFHPIYINVGTHGVVLDTILTGSFITPLPILYSVLFTLLFVPLVLISITNVKPSLRSMYGFIGVALAFILPLLFFIITKMFLAPLSAILAMVTAVIIRELTAFVSSEREKRFIRQAFSTYLSSSVVSELIADPSKLNLGGGKREMTALFTDLQGFSTFSENMDPSHLVRVLNKYLTVMSNIIMDNQGTIDKYIGDAIVSFFGAPVYREDHAALACYSALAMKQAEDELNAQLLAEGLSTTPLFTRIGINTGEMVVGNMGSDSKMNYTIMGNAVNLTARLEGVNKQYHTSIIISEYTREQAGSVFLSRHLDRVQVVGIHQPVVLYELTGIAGNADQDELLFHKKWKEAISLFEQSDFAQAKDLFSALSEIRPQDPLAAKYVQRCSTFMIDPPPPDWDKVFSLSEK